MPKKYVPSYSELSFIQEEITGLLRDVPRDELYRIMENAMDSRLRMCGLDVDESESEEENNSSSDDECVDYKSTSSDDEKSNEYEQHSISSDDEFTHNY
jgi:hypothetical protein